MDRAEFSARTGVEVGRRLDFLAFWAVFRRLRTRVRIRLAELEMRIGGSGGVETRRGSGTGLGHVRFEIGQ